MGAADTHGESRLARELGPGEAWTRSFRGTAAPGRLRGTWSLTGRGAEAPGVAPCSARTLVCVLRTVGFRGCPAACEVPPLCLGSPRPPGAFPTHSAPAAPSSAPADTSSGPVPVRGARQSRAAAPPPTRQHPHDAAALMPVVRRVALWGTKLTWKENELGVKR